MKKESERTSEEEEEDGEKEEDKKGNVSYLAKNRASRESNRVLFAIYSRRTMEERGRLG